MWRSTYNSSNRQLSPAQDRNKLYAWSCWVNEIYHKTLSRTLWYGNRILHAFISGLN